MTDEIKIKVARVGIDAEVFKRSDFGRYLVAQAEREIKEETQILVGLDPYDTKSNRESRNKIHVASMFLTWLEQAIGSGQLATDQLRNEDGENAPDY